MSSAIMNTKILYSVVMNNVKPVFCIVQLSTNSSTCLLHCAVLKKFKLPTNRHFGYQTSCTQHFPLYLFVRMFIYMRYLINDVQCTSLISLLSYFSSDALVKPTCDSKDCENNITMFCVPMCIIYV